LIASEQTIERIRSSRHRQRTLELPVVYGEMGELKRCQYKPGKAYPLHPASRYDEHRATAGQQPTRARAVVYLLAQYERQVKPLTITVLSVTRAGEHWLVHFDLGDKTAHNDIPVYLTPTGSGGDYTTTPSRALDKVEVMTPLAKDLEEARRKAREGRITPQQQQLDRAVQEAETLRQAMTSMKARNRVNLILKEMEKLASELSADAGATLPASACAARQVSAAVEGEPRPSGIESVVSLETAA
jgi:hypothetical protein